MCIRDRGMNYLEKFPSLNRAMPLRCELPKEVPLLESVSYTHLRAHETPEHLVCRLLLEKKNFKKNKIFFFFFFFLMIRRPPRSTLDRSSAASDVYKRQGLCP